MARVPDKEEIAASQEEQDQFFADVRRFDVQQVEKEVQESIRQLEEYEGLAMPIYKLNNETFAERQDLEVTLKEKKDRWLILNSMKKEERNKLFQTQQQWEKKEVKKGAKEVITKLEIPLPGVDEVLYLRHRVETTKGGAKLLVEHWAETTTMRYRKVIVPQDMVFSWQCCDTFMDYLFMDIKE